MKSEEGYLEGSVGFLAVVGLRRFASESPEWAKKTFNQLVGSGVDLDSDEVQKVLLDLQEKKILEIINKDSCYVRVHPDYRTDVFGDDEYRHRKY